MASNVVRARDIKVFLLLFLQKKKSLPLWAQVQTSITQVRGFAAERYAPDEKAYQARFGNIDPMTDEDMIYYMPKLEKIKGKLHSSTTAGDENSESAAASNSGE